MLHASGYIGRRANSTDDPYSLGRSYRSQLSFALGLAYRVPRPQSQYDH